jgi:uncharacterized membrane protein
MKEDNTVFVLQKAIKALKIKVTSDSVRESLLGHPYYPTLKSISEVLKRWEVAHHVVRLEKNEIENVEIPFIAHLNSQGGQLAFVKKIRNEKVHYQTHEGKTEIEGFVEFAQKMSGVIILIETDQNNSEKSYRYKRHNEILEKTLIPAIIFCFFILTIAHLMNGAGSLLFTAPRMVIFLIATKVVGFFSSLMLVLHELKIDTPLADKICGISSNTDCDTVLSSKAARVYGWINWADTGLIFFTGSFIYLLGINDSTSLGTLGILALFALPYPIFSTYYQGIKLKKWCPFCLIVQVILIAESVILLPFVKSTSFFLLSDWISLIASVSLAGTVWLIYKSLWQQSRDKKQIRHSYLQLKRNPELFRFLLKENGFNQISIEDDSLVLGKSKASVTITAFLSLYCGPCADAFNKIKAVLEANQGINVNVLFSVYNDEQTHKVINYIYYLQAHKGNVAVIEFLQQWYSTPKKERSSLYKNQLIPELDQVAQKVAKKNGMLFSKYKIGGTPTLFVNGMMYPSSYELDQIPFYLDEINNGAEELKRQEAYSVSN